MKLNRKNKKGFTIVELVIVIAVIGILAAILIPTFTNLTKNAQEQAKKQTVSDAYTVYLAEAVDGKYDLFTYDSTKEQYIDANITLPNKKQSEVVMKYKDEYFTYNQEKGWENKGKDAPTGMGSVVCQKYTAAFTAEVKLYDTEHVLKFTFANGSSKDDANEALSTFNSVIVYSATVNA